MEWGERRSSVAVIADVGNVGFTVRVSGRAGDGSGGGVVSC